MGNFVSSSLVTAKASQLGISARPRSYTYPRSMIVEMMFAYVDGRPISLASKVFTSDASV